MNLKAIMAEISAALDPALKEAGFSNFDYPKGSITAPAALLGYPERMKPHNTYNNGMWRITLPLIVVAGRVNEESAADLMGEICSDVGEKSITMIVEGASYTTLDAVTVEQIDFDVVDVAAVSYIAAMFTLDIAVSRR